MIMNQAREAGDSGFTISRRPLRGLNVIGGFDPGAYAPGFMLASAPRTQFSISRHINAMRL